MGYEKFMEKAFEIFTGFSCERFLGISADFLQNCYLGSKSWKRRLRRKKALKTPCRKARSMEIPVCEEGRKRAPHVDKTTTELRPLHLQRPMNASYSEAVKTVKSFKSPVSVHKK